CFGAELRSKRADIVIHRILLTPGLATFDDVDHDAVWLLQVEHGGCLKYGAKTTRSGIAARDSPVSRDHVARKPVLERRPHVQPHEKGHAAEDERERRS